MGHRTSVWRAAALIVTAISLVGCVTPGDFPLRYTSWSFGELRQGDLRGQTYALIRLELIGKVSSSEAERAAGFQEIDAHLAGYGLTRADDFESADLIIDAFIGYEPSEDHRKDPTYVGGGTERVEVLRRSRHYDEQGRYIGTWRDRETEYRTAPPVLTGYESRIVKTEQPIVALMVYEADVYQADADYGTVIAEDFPYVFMGVAISDIYPTTLSQTGHCLIREVLRGFPAPHTRTAHHAPSNFDCAFFTEHPELLEEHGTPAS